LYQLLRWVESLVLRNPLLRPLAQICSRDKVELAYLPVLVAILKSRFLFLQMNSKYKFADNDNPDSYREYFKRHPEDHGF
jgi:hypothetical protein